MNLLGNVSNNTEKSALDTLDSMVVNFWHHPKTLSFGPLLPFLSAQTTRVEKKYVNGAVTK